MQGDKKLHVQTNKRIDLAEPTEPALAQRLGIGIARGARADAVVRRCSFHSSPWLSNSPCPVTGRKIRIEAGDRR